MEKERDCPAGFFMKSYLILALKYNRKEVQSMISS